MVASNTIGAALAIGSAIVSNFGVNVQKYSHTDNERLPVKKQKAYVRRPLWWLGLFLVIAGSIGDFAAFGFATQALVASLGGGTTMVANVVIAHYFNKETLYRTDLLGVICIITGTGIIAIITDPDKNYNLQDLEERFGRPGFIAYLIVVGLSTMSLLATIKGSLANKLKNQLRWSKQRQKQLMKSFERRFQEMEDRVEELERAMAKRSKKKSIVDDAEEVFHVKKAKIQHVEDVMEGLASRDHVPYYYAICSGVVGAISVLLAKCLALMIKTSLHGDNQFVHPISYAFIIGMGVTLLVQTHLLNMATILGDTMTVFPIFQSFWITFSVIGGIVFYDTAKEFTTTKWIFYPTALLLVGIGVLFLIQHEEKKRASLVGCRMSSLDHPIEDISTLIEEAMDEPLLPSHMATARRLIL